MSLAKAHLHRSSSVPVSVGRTSSINLVDDAEKRINEEIKQLVRDIRRIGPTYPSPAPHVLFGELFDDEFAQQYYEALLGTLKAAKKRGIIKFKGQMLLKGMHDKVVVSIVDECPPPPITLPRGGQRSGTKNATIALVDNKFSVENETMATSSLSGADTPTAPSDEAVQSRSVENDENADREGDQNAPENTMHKRTSDPPPKGNRGETEQQQKSERRIDGPAKATESWTTSTPSSSSKMFGFTTPEREEYQQRVEQNTQNVKSSKVPQSKGNWRPAPWRQQRPQSTTALSGPTTNPKKKDGKRRLSAPIPRKEEESKSEMTTDSNRPDTDGGSGRINVNMCSVPEDVTLKAPPNASSRGNGGGGLSKAAAAALGGTQTDSNNSASKTTGPRRFLRPRKSGEGMSISNSSHGEGNNSYGEEDEASVSSSIGGASIASAPARVMRAGSSAAVEAHKARLDEEIDQLLLDIRRVGTNPGEPNVAFGDLFDDDEVQNYYEALVGTLKSAKRRGVVNFKGQMLLKGMHDNVMIEIVNP